MKRTNAFTTSLLALPLALLVSVPAVQAWPWSKPPEITASSREDAMDKCMADANLALNKAKRERARAKADPKSADFDANPNVYSEYTYNFLLDDEWETVEITQIYCKPSKNTKHKEYWHNRGYLEYIKRPTDKSFSVETEVDKVIVSYGYTWKEQ